MLSCIKLAYLCLCSEGEVHIPLSVDRDPASHLVIPKINVKKAHSFLKRDHDR